MSLERHAFLQENWENATNLHKNTCKLDENPHIFLAFSQKCAHFHETGFLR